MNPLRSRPCIYVSNSGVPCSGIAPAVAAKASAVTIAPIRAVTPRLMAASCKSVVVNTVPQSTDTDTRTAESGSFYTDGVPKLQLVGDTDADALLGADPFALLVGMLLDQQVPWRSRS